MLQIEGTANSENYETEGNRTRLVWCFISHVGTVIDVLAWDGVLAAEKK